jgi:hypothetical protein
LEIGQVGPLHFEVTSLKRKLWSFFGGGQTYEKGAVKVERAYGFRVVFKWLFQG